MGLYDILDLLATFSALLIILPFHEFAHAYAAVKNGDITPKIHNRYTLNPFAHFDASGLLLFLFAGFGWAKPVPVNPYNFNNYNKGMFQVSIAGVLTNYVLAFLAFPLIYVFNRYLPDIALFDEFLKFFIYSFVTLNLYFCVFNLLPLFPLDGFRVWESLRYRKGRIFYFFKNNGYYILIGLVLLSLISRMLSLPQINILGRVLSYLYNIAVYPISKFWGLFI